MHPRKRKLRARTEAQTHSAENRDVVLEKPPNPYKLYFNLRRQVKCDDTLLIYEGSKSSKPHPERKAIAEHFCCGNTLPFLIKL